MFPTRDLRVNSVLNLVVAPEWYPSLEDFHQVQPL